MQDPLDELLSQALLQPKEHFVHNVMHKVQALPAPLVVRPISRWEWLSLVASLVLGAQPLWSFITVVWLSVSTS